MSCRQEWFAEFMSSRDEFVYLGDETKITVEGRGQIFIKRFINDAWIDGVINDVLYLPSLNKNLLFIGVCTSNGCSVIFNCDCTSLFSKNDILMARGLKLNNNLTRMLIRTEGDFQVNYASTVPLKVWHERLGYANRTCIENMIKNNAVSGFSVKNKNEHFCEDCPLGKQVKAPFKKNEKIISQILGEIIHTDLCGPVQTPSIGGARFFLLFKDEAFGFRTVYFLKHKSDTFDAIKKFFALSKNQFGGEINIFGADNGTEYINQNVKDFLEARGIKLFTSAPHIPKQNGRAEREMRTILESARTMLLAKNLPTRLWAEAVNTAVYVLNRTLSARSDVTTPFELWYNKKPNISHLRDAFWYQAEFSDHLCCSLMSNTSAPLSLAVCIRRFWASFPLPRLSCRNLFFFFFFCTSCHSPSSCRVWPLVTAA